MSGAARLKAVPFQIVFIYETSFSSGVGWAEQVMFRDLEVDPHSDLRGEGNADGSAGTEEVSERAGRNQQLIRVRNRYVASWSRAERRRIVERSEERRVGKECR